MRKVTARELRALGVGHGERLGLPEGSDVEVVKAAICEELERLHGDDEAMWIRVLKRAKKRISKEPGHTAICQLLARLEASSGKRACVGMSPPPGRHLKIVKGTDQR